MLGWVAGWPKSYTFGQPAGQPPENNAVTSARLARPMGGL